MITGPSRLTLLPSIRFGCWLVRVIVPTVKVIRTGPLTSGPQSSFGRRAMVVCIASVIEHWPLSIFVSFVALTTIDAGRISARAGGAATSASASNTTSAKPLWRRRTNDERSRGMDIRTLLMDHVIYGAL